MSPSPSVVGADVGHSVSVAFVLAGLLHLEGVKDPGAFCAVDGGFPPAVADDHVVAAVLIEIADAQAVIKAVRTVVQPLLFRVARRADGIKGPLGIDLGLGGMGRWPIWSSGENP